MGPASPPSPAIDPATRQLQQQAEQDRLSAIDARIAGDTRSLSARFGALTEGDTASVLARYGRLKALSGAGMLPGLQLFPGLDNYGRL